MIDEYPFSGPDFEIGKLYIDRAKALISVRVSETKGIRVRPIEQQLTDIGGFHYQYRLCEFTELNKEELKFYQTVVMGLIQKPTITVCTCPINVLMTSGCKCGGT